MGLKNLPRQQYESWYVSWPHNREMPVIQGRDFLQPKALSYRDHRGVDDTQRGHARHVLVRKFDHMEAVVTERPQERHFRMRSYSGLRQISHLAQHRRRHKQRPLSRTQQRQTRVVNMIFNVARRQQHTGVAQ